MGNDTDSRLSQFRKGVVELAILALLHAGEALVARLRSLIVERPAAWQGRALSERFTIDSLAPEYRVAFERLASPR